MPSPNHAGARLAVVTAAKGLNDKARVFVRAHYLSEREELEKAGATAAVFEILARTAKRGGDELTLESDISSLATPMAMVQMRRLMHPAQAKKR